MTSKYKLIHQSKRDIFIIAFAVNHYIDIFILIKSLLYTPKSILNTHENNIKQKIYCTCDNNK